MKKLVITLVLSITIAICNCKLYSQIHFSNSDSVINFLVGKWIWTGYCGGTTGHNCEDPKSVGYTRSYTYSKIVGSKDNISYSYFKNDTLIKSGKTKISYSNSIYGDEWNLENIPGFTTEKMTLFFNSIESITLADNCYDCYSHNFVRNDTLTDNTTTNANLELFDNNFIVYPNPGKNCIQFKLNNPSEIEKLTIYNVNGIIIKNYRNIDSSIDISELSNGIYFIELIKGKETYRTKIIKE